MSPAVERRPTGEIGVRHAGAASQRTVARGPQTVTINHGSTFLVCGPEGGIRAEEGQEQGLHAEDRRFLSGHELRLNGRPLQGLSSSRLSFRHARWMLLAPSLRTIDGRATDVRVTVSVDRHISARRLDEEIILSAYGSEPITLLLALHLESDFADLLEVRTERWQRRRRPAHRRRGAAAA